MKNTIVLDNNSKEIQYLSNNDKRLASLISIIGNLSYETYEDLYSFIVCQIISQMLSIKAANKIYTRLEELCNNQITAEKINILSYEKIKNIGISNSKTKSIKEFTSAVINREIDLDSFKNLSDDDIIKKLTKIHGIGSWTSKMFLIFCLNRQNILPYEDLTFIAAYKWLYKLENTTKDYVIKNCQKWQPYSSIAARYLYKAFDDGLVYSLIK